MELTKSVALNYVSYPPLRLLKRALLRFQRQLGYLNVCFVLAIVVVETYWDIMMRKSRLPSS